MTDAPITDAEREAAANFLEYYRVHAWEKSVANIRAGKADKSHSVQAFANHAAAAVAEERALIERLRKRIAALEHHIKDNRSRSYAFLSQVDADEADIIERRDHRPGVAAIGE